MTVQFRTTARISAMLAAGVKLHTREDDPIAALQRTYEENSAAYEQRLADEGARYQTLLRAAQAGGVSLPREVRDGHGNVVIPAASRRYTIEGTRSVLDGPETRQVEALRAEREAIGGFLRSGGETRYLEAFDEIETRSMGADNDPAGGYLVVPQLSNAINQRVWDVSPLARLARKVEITTGDSFEEPIDASDIGAEWVGERSDRPELKEAELKYLRVPLHEIYTNQPVTQRLLDDSRFNIGAFVEGKISDKFSRSEGAAYIHGDGRGKPQGLLYKPTSPLPDGERDFFTLQHIETFPPGDGFGLDGTDRLISLVYLLRAPYRQNARWLMNYKTAGYIRRLKDEDGNLLWANGIAQGQPPLLLGYPVELDEEMPDMANGAMPIAFGDFAQAYIIVERPGIKLLVDPYTKKPLVLFYAYRRCGGQIQNGEAVKVLKFTSNPST